MAAKVEILEIVELPDGDGLLVSGTVEGYDVGVRDAKGKLRKRPAVFVAQAWKSHLYGDHEAVNKQRAADAKRESADSAKAADEHTEVTEIEIPLLDPAEHLRDDGDRKRYLAGLLVAAAEATRENATPAAALTGTISV